MQCRNFAKVSNKAVEINKSHFFQTVAEGEKDGRMTGQLLDSCEASEDGGAMAGRLAQIGAQHLGTHGGARMVEDAQQRLLGDGAVVVGDFQAGQRLGV